MPAFDDLEYFPKLVLTEADPGVVKSPWEELQVAPPGQADRLVLYYDALVTSYAALNAALLAYPAATNMSLAAETTGTWYSTGETKLASPKEELPFARIAVPCVGLAASKPDAVRWFAVTESQSGENILYSGTVWPKLQAEILSVGVEIDKILTSAPSMNTVGTNQTPPSAPSVRTSDWTSLDNPTRHYPDGWVLVDIRSQQLAGTIGLWLATYVYRYKYPYSP